MGFLFSLAHDLGFEILSSLAGDKEDILFLLTKETDVFCLRKHKEPS